MFFESFVELDGSNVRVSWNTPAWRLVTVYSVPSMVIAGNFTARTNLVGLPLPESRKGKPVAVLARIVFIIKVSDLFLIYYKNSLNEIEAVGGTIYHL